MRAHIHVLHHCNSRAFLHSQNCFDSPIFTLCFIGILLERRGQLPHSIKTRLGSVDLVKYYVYRKLNNVQITGIAE
jgi:hypothetical protein